MHSEAQEGTSGEAPDLVSGPMEAGQAGGT